MKAVVLTGYGDVCTLEVHEVPEPRAEPGAIVVRMAGASINPVDWKTRSGAIKDFAPVTFPTILGRDASGVVVEVGEGVSTFATGNRVLGLVREGYAELVAAPRDNWTKIPGRLDTVDAGALPLVLLTGAQLIEEAVNAGRGDVVLVTGAVGSVGRTAVFAAKMRGATVWALVRASQRGEAERLGVAGVVASEDERAIASLPMLDAIADTVGGEVIQSVLWRLRKGGVLGSVVGEPKSERDDVTVRTFLTRADPPTLDRYARAVAEGAFVIPIARRLPLADVRAAHALAEKGRPGGKVLLTG